MNQVIEIQKEDLTNSIIDAKKELSRFKKRNGLETGVYNTLKARIGNRHNGTPDSKISYTAESLENALGVFNSIKNRLDSEQIFSEEVKGEISKNMIALYGGALAGLNHISQFMKEYDEDNLVESIELNYSSKNLGDEFVATFVEGVTKEHKIKTSEELANVGRGFYLRTIEQIVEEKENSPEEFKSLEGITIQLEGITIKGVERIGGSQSQNIKYKTDFKDLVGISNIESEIKEQINRLFWLWQEYKDGEEGAESALNDLKHLMLLYGPPGTGKTSIIKATAKYMKEYAEEAGIPFKEIEIDNELKTKWYGESPRKLRNKFKEASDFDGVCFVWTDEADILYSKDPNQSGSAEGEFLAEAMKSTDGVNRDMKNFFYMCTTNNVDKVYAPLKSRFEKNEHLVLGPSTKEEHAFLFTQLTGRYRDSGIIDCSKEDILRLGEMFMEYEFKGRDNNGFYKTLINKIESEVDLSSKKINEIPKGKRREYRMSQMKILNFDKIEKMVHKYGASPREY